jgi:hypothetical protein
LRLANPVDRLVTVGGVGTRFWRVWSGESVSGLGDAAFAVAAATGALAAVDVRLAFAVAAGPVLAVGIWLLASPATRALGVAPPAGAARAA